MDKYRGKYRVATETDRKTGNVLESSFIPCKIKKGSNICRHNANTLNAYIKSSIITNRLVKEYPHIFSHYQQGDGEGTILFPEIFIGEVEKILKPYTIGKNVSPRARKRNARFI